MEKKIEVVSTFSRSQASKILLERLEKSEYLAHGLRIVHNGASELFAPEVGKALANDGRRAEAILVRNRMMCRRLVG